MKPLMRNAMMSLAILLSHHDTFAGDRTKSFGPSEYRVEALSLMLHEANAAAAELQLPETMPIKREDLKGTFVAPIAFARSGEGAGNIETRTYSYYFGQMNKLWVIDLSHQDEFRSKAVKDSVLPISSIDTNSALKVATNWLKRFHVDTERLSRACNLEMVHAIPEVEPESRFFVPIYIFNWEMKESHELAVKLSLYLPTKQLISLRVKDTSFNLRPSLQFTNLDAYMANTSTNFNPNPKTNPGK